jgi:hypothetical protein
LLDDDVFDLFFDRFFRHKICSVCVGRAWVSHRKIVMIRAQQVEVNELGSLSIIFRWVVGTSRCDVGTA